MYAYAQLVRINQLPTKYNIGVMNVLVKQCSLSAIITMAAKSQVAHILEPL